MPQPFPNLAKMFNERFGYNARSMSETFPTMPSPLLVSRIKWSQSVTWLVSPVGNKWSVQFYVHTDYHGYMVLNR